MPLRGLESLLLLLARLPFLYRTTKQRRRHQGWGPDLPIRRSTKSSRLVLGLELQFALVLFEKPAQGVGCVEQAIPLLVVEGDREASEPIYAHASLFTDLE